MSEKQEDIKEIIKKAGLVPSDTLIETIIVNSKNYEERKREVEELINLRTQDVKGMIEKGRAKKENLTKIRKEIIGSIFQNRYFILARDKKNNKPIGFVHAFSPEIMDEAGLIARVYVSPEYRMKGMGKKLERKGIFYLMKKDSTKLVLGQPSSIGGEKLAKYRSGLVLRADLGEFDEALARWQLKEKKQAKVKEKKKPKRARRK